MTLRAVRLVPILAASAAAAAMLPSAALATRSGADDAGHRAAHSRADHQHAAAPGASGGATGARVRRSRSWVDLTTSDLQIDGSADDGDRVDVGATVDNDGTRSVRPSFVTISLVADGGDGEDDPVRLAKVPVGRIAAGASTTIQATVTIPGDLPDGDLSLEVCADGTELRRERDEDNNCASQPLIVGLDTADDEDENDD